mgnify:CR=1 FL=1
MRPDKGEAAGSRRQHRDLVPRRTGVAGRRRSVAGSLLGERRSHLYRMVPHRERPGSGVGRRIESSDTFYSHLGGSPVLQHQLDSTTTEARTLIANLSVHYTQYWANNTNAPANGQSVSDAQMVAMLQSGFNPGALTYDPNTAVRHLHRRHGQSRR